MAYALLFAASTVFSESITASKYSSYVFYQERVGMFLPTSTLLKGLWLSLTGRKDTVDNAVWKSKGGAKQD